MFCKSMRRTMKIRILNKKEDDTVPGTVPVIPYK